MGPVLTHSRIRLSGNREMNVMKLPIGLAGLLLCAVLGAAAFSGSTDVAAQDANGCEVRDQKGAMAIVICPPGLSEVELRKAGEAACTNVTPCIAFFWDDGAKAPDVSPPLPDGLTKQQIRDSLAVWNNVEKQLMMISKNN